MRFYLAGPINGRTDSACRDWRERARHGLALAGHSVFDPMSRDYRGRELEPGIATQIVEQDKRDIRDCDVVLVYFDAPSVGTAMEVLYAFTYSIPVAVVDAAGGRPLSPWLIYHAGKIFASLDEAIRHFSSSGAPGQFFP